MEKNSSHPEEQHKSGRSNWLRASVLGVNDGVVSTSSLMLGVAGAAAGNSAILTAGIAGLSAGALSMAIGEYVSVSSQRDSEKADIAIEKASLKNNPEEELEELVEIYQKRGLDRDLAQKVAEELHSKNAIDAHLRDEIGIDRKKQANPLQAGFASAISFSIGSAFPIAAAFIGEGMTTEWIMVLFSLIALAGSGAIGAFLGGGNRLWAAGRVLVGGALAMAVTFTIGLLLGAHL
jgi:VIT1/CCC1 family predicted Fe2+/Mn2+ transporter